MAATCGWRSAGCLSGKVRLSWMTPVRWSRYNRYYLEPVISKEQQRTPATELSNEERAALEQKALQPIKAAPTDTTSSVFCDPMINKFINMMMKGGQKLLSRSIMNKTFELIKRKQIESYHKAPESAKDVIECNPHKIFHQALENCQPIIGLTSVQRGGKSYQVPTPLKDNRRRFLAMKWLITECRDNRHRRTQMPEKLSQELLAAFKNEGNVVKKKHDLHKMAEANRAFAHYRWW